MLCVFILLAVLGTLCDVCNVSAKINTGSNQLLLRVLNCFSVYSNGKKILSTAKIDGSIDCIHGLRCFSMVWVVLGHTWFAMVQTPTDGIFALADVSFHLCFKMIV